jgi:hypothetical protein
MKCFDIAIMAEKTDILISLTSSWPNWEELATSQSGESLFHFAITQDRFKAVDILLKRGIDGKVG